MTCSCMSERRLAKSCDLKQSFVPCLQQTFPKTRQASQGFLYMSDAICEATAQCTTRQQQNDVQCVELHRFQDYESVHLAAL